MDASESVAWFVKGSAELKLGRTTDSITSLSKAIELRPGQPAFFKQRRLAYIKAGDMEKAERDMASAEQCSEASR